MARILFLHRYFPGQYQHLAPALANNPANRVVFLAMTGEGTLDRVERRTYRPTRMPREGTHKYLVSLESAVLAGQAVYRACEQLRREGFVPDVVCAHSGFGPALYVKDVFPDTPLLGYFEWLYRGPGRDAEYLTGQELTPDEACRARTRNASILMDLAACDFAVTPTQFQRAQFPSPFGDKLRVLHDGVDTDFFHPRPVGRLHLPGREIPADAELLTYATRGMEPHRGFAQFMAAAAMLIRSRPKLHVLIAGEDITVYSRNSRGEGTYRERALSEHPELSSERVHFVGRLDYANYCRLLQASSVHVYLTVPFILSWSLLEAMATGCLIVASDTDPVTEVMSDGETGLLVDFRDVPALARRIDLALDQRDDFEPLRRQARKEIERRYALRRLLPRHIALVEGLVTRTRRPRSMGCDDEVRNGDRLW